LEKVKKDQRDSADQLNHPMGMDGKQPASSNFTGQEMAVSQIKIALALCSAAVMGSRT
jgi:hypothetical protein